MDWTTSPATKGTSQALPVRVWQSEENAQY